MSESSRIQRWRENKRQAGLKAVTVWLAPEEEMLLKDRAIQARCSPSDLIHQMLVQYTTVNPQDNGSPTDTLPIQQLQEDVAALQETIDTLQGTLPALVQQIVREEMAALPVVSAPDAVGITVDPTDTEDFVIPATVGITVGPTDTEPLEHQLATDQASVTDILTDMITDTPADIPTDSPTDTMATPAPPRRSGGRPPVMRKPILDLLREHPAGLTVEEIRAYLKPEKPLGDTLAGMRRDGAVKIQGEGRARLYLLP